MNNLFPPMSPILADKIPVGSDWAYQLKWDGVRIITELNGQQVKLYSKNGQPKEHVYPAVVHTLQSIGVRGVFDGEMIVFDPVTKRPDFGKILTLEKQRGRQQDRTHPAIYVLFDLLALNGMDFRQTPYKIRHQKLVELFHQPLANVMVADLFTDGHKLWQWVCDHHWEGIVSKRLSSSYSMNKQHQDWFKKKKAFTTVVDIVGIVLNVGLPKSLIMRYEDRYIGKVSLGLTTADRQLLLQFIQNEQHITDDPHFPLAQQLENTEFVWLKHPLLCEVTALEFTAGGLLRHPKIVKFYAKD